jgi:hypothetical protein
MNAKMTAFEAKLPNLVATLAIASMSLNAPVQHLWMKVHKPVTAATLFGIISWTPAKSSARSTRTETSTPKVGGKSSSSCGSASRFGIARELFALTLQPDAFLKPESPMTSDWTTHTRPVGVQLYVKSGDNRNEQLLDTIFEILKLARHQCDQAGMYRNIKASTELCPEDERTQYHVILDLTGAQYDAFAKKVSRARGCFVYL